MAEVITIPTRHGDARAHVYPAPSARGALVLGHGAGGGVQAPDLQAARTAALEQGFTVALVEQPYRVAGRRSPAPARHCDAALLDVLGRLASETLAGLPLVLGGRSMGARIACRTAGEAEAAGVLCLAFPLLPPQRAGSAKAPESRIAELAAVAVPVLVIQGRGDRFGIPPAAPGRTVITVAGDHGLKRDLAAVGAEAGAWLASLPVASA